MLSKALKLEKNEDFLGDTHLKLAAILIEENLLENALFELETYKKHRESKCWKLSATFESLYSKVQSVKLNVIDNKGLYSRFIPIAENFAYQDISWIEFVLIDKWKNEDKKERVAFVNSDSSVEFSVGVNRFFELKKFKIGQVCKFKLYKQEIKKEVESQYSWQPKKVIKEYKYIPLIVEKSEREDWSIFDDCIAFVEYINKEKNIVHTITFDNREVFFPQSDIELQIGEFVTAKFYTKKVKGENRVEFRNIQKIDKDKVISKFQSQIAVVDGINERKQLFHFVINQKLQGVIKYSETELRPQEGDFIKVWFVTKIDKERKTRIRILKIEPTEEINSNLRKDVSGLLEVKYKNNSFDRDWEDEDFDENWNVKTNIIKPDFAFINDFYIPKYLLEKYNITTDCAVKAKAVFAGDKWKVYDLEKQ